MSAAAPKVTMSELTEDPARFPDAVEESLRWMPGQNGRGVVSPAVEVAR
jgi:hypothetical protein